MPRPRRKRRIRFSPNATYFKPQGVPLRLLEEISLAADEMQALKLHDVDGLDQTKSAAQMDVSQSTFNRILNRAYHKVAKALVQGKAIKIETPQRKV